MSDILQFGLRTWDDRSRGQSDLFAGRQSDEVMELGSLPECESWSQGEMSRYEKAAVGFYLSVHPLDHYQDTLQKLAIKKLADFEELVAGQSVFLAGLVSGLQVRYSKKGNRFATFRLEDQSGGIKCIAWGEAFGRISALLGDDELIIAEGRIEASEGQEETLIINDVKLLADAEPMRAREATISLPDSISSEDFYERVFGLLGEHRGECGVSLRIPAKEVETEMAMPHIRIKGSALLARKLNELGCEVRWLV